VITVEGVSAGFKNVRVLHDITLAVEAGRLVAVIGANGAGKTTLLRTLSNVIQASSGRIFFQGEPTAGVATHMLARKGIVHVPQGRQIVPTISVRDNLLLGAQRVPLIGRDEMQENLQREFERFPVLRERQDIPGGSLSGGEQQMLAVSRALMMQPKLLMLDEPSLGLAPQIVATILRALRQLADQGLAVLLVEQLAMLALKNADAGYVLQRGRIVLSGAASDILANPAMVDSYLK
jgi:branched-chain amino acid transport system ATP-binding protein